MNVRTNDDVPLIRALLSRGAHQEGPRMRSERISQFTGRLGAVSLEILR